EALPVQEPHEAGSRVVGGVEERKRHGGGGYRLLAALLDVRLHELLGVGLEDVVDLVEQVVELRLDLLAGLGLGGCLGDLGLLALGGRLADLFTLGHRAHLIDRTTPARPAALPGSRNAPTTYRRGRAFHGT